MVVSSGNLQQIVLSLVVVLSLRTRHIIIHLLQTDWIDTQFGTAYVLKVYKGDPNSGGTLLPAGGSGSNDGWFFDYSSGVLNFNGSGLMV